MAGRSETIFGRLAISLQNLSHNYNGYPLTVSTIFTVLFTSASAASLVLEITRRCNPDLQLWLGVMTTYSFVRWILRVILEGLTLEYIPFPSNLPLVYKIIEMVDIFGMVWFSVGNLLVFNGTRCSDPESTPMTFWVCLIYIILGYMSLIIPMLVRWCVNAQFPPMPAVRNALSDPHAEPVNDYAVTTRNDMWRRWLAGYQCIPVQYKDVKSKPPPAEDPAPFEATEDSTLKPVEEAGVGTNCPICLVDFDDDFEVINYPCISRTHYFHTTCMYDWLKVASRRGFDNITCPCCRQTPRLLRRSVGAPARRPSAQAEVQRRPSFLADAISIPIDPPHFLPHPASVHPLPAPMVEESVENDSELDSRITPRRHQT